MLSKTPRRGTGADTCAILDPVPTLTGDWDGHACPHGDSLTRRHGSLSSPTPFSPPPSQRWNVQIGIPDKAFFILGDSMLQEVVR